MTSATGAVPVITCPVSRASPGFRALRRRSSIGSRSRAAASLSIWDSTANPVCTAPNPRMAPHGGLLVRTTLPSMTALGTRYGPAAKHEALPSTAAEDDW